MWISREIWQSPLPLSKRRVAADKLLPLCCAQAATKLVVCTDVGGQGLQFVFKNQIRQCIQLLLIALTLVFIFSNSLPSIEESKADSMGVMQMIAPFLEFFVGKGNVTLYFVRKLAHFAEFGILGLQLGILIKKPKSSAFLFAILCAMTDETIQIFTGRGSQVQDVWLDFVGASTGILAGIAILYLIQTIRNRRKPT